MSEIQVLAAARALAAEAAAAATETESRRRLPPGLVEAMSGAGVYRLLVPAAVGGLEEHPRVLVEAVEALAAGDGAAGWCAAIGATSGLLAAYLPEHAAREVYGASPRVVTGGAFAPKGRAVAVDGGFRVSGRWPFASGCQDCDWLMGGCVVEDDGSVRMMLAPAGQVRVHDTWNVVGLRGTGSHDIEFDDVHVPAEHSASLFSGRPVQPGPLYAFPLFGLLAVAIGAVCLGIARGALDDLTEMAAGKTPTGGRRTLAERPSTQVEVARGAAAVRAARALLLETVDEAWTAAVGSGEVPVDRRAALRMAATHAATVGAEVTGAVYGLGGGSAVYETSALPRRFRDVNVATHHMLVAPATWELTGRILLGQVTDTTQL